MRACAAFGGSVGCSLELHSRSWSKWQPKSLPRSPAMPRSGVPAIWLFFAGIVAADPTRGIVIKGYADLPADMRKRAGETGEMSVDTKDGPIAAQSWYILEHLRQTVAAAGGTLSDVVKLTQYFRDLRDFPAYNRIRTQFFPEPPASTVVRVLELLKV